jgi:hypothetical protein
VVHQVVLENRLPLLLVKTAPHGEICRGMLATRRILKKKLLIAAASGFSVELKNKAYANYK